MKHKLSIFSILLVSCLCISSCEKLARNKIIGLWTATDYVLTSDDGTTMPKTPEMDEVFDKWRKGSTIEFFDDGTAAITSTDRCNYQYSIQGNIITITGPKVVHLDYNFELTIRIEGERLVTVNYDIYDYFGDGVAYPGHMVYMDWILTR